MAMYSSFGDVDASVSYSSGGDAQQAPNTEHWFPNGSDGSFQYDPVVMYMEQHFPAALHGTNSTDAKVMSAIRSSFLGMGFRGANPANIVTPATKLAEALLNYRWPITERFETHASDYQDQRANYYNSILPIIIEIGRQVTQSVVIPINPSLLRMFTNRSHSNTRSGASPASSSSFPMWAVAIGGALVAGGIAWYALRG